VNELSDTKMKLPKLLESPVKEVKKDDKSVSGQVRKARGRPPKNAGQLVLNECGICSTKKDQHLLALCDSCRLYFHIGCLDPPLRRLPKKSRFGGWQCSDCTEKEEESEDEADKDSGPEDNESATARRLRESRKGPDKFVPDADQSAALLSPKKKRGRPPGSTSVGKKKKSKKVRIKVELSPPPHHHGATAEDNSIMSLDSSQSSSRRAKFKEEPVDKDCCKCGQTASTKDLVQCDECELFYHFGCLDPPRKKTPKQRGYDWICQECDPSSSSESGSDDGDENEAVAVGVDGDVQDEKENTENKD
jgi:hypothetical protein